jgi:ABC-type Fe3+ transport system substrate-binding protein
VPERWSDLLDPAYHNNIIIGGPDGVNELLLLDLYKELGDTAVRQLAPNVKDTWHAAQMAKTAGTGSSKGAAIYVLPWFFAKTCPHTRVVSIIWPGDGALVNPMYFLLKKSRAKDLGPLVDFVTGAEFGTKMAETYFPPLHPGTGNHLPEKARLKWLGWDFVYSRDVGGLIEYVTQIFMDEWQKPK